MQTLIGLIRPKNSLNIAQVLRAASCFDVNTVLVEGARYKKMGADTTKYHRHHPVLTVDEIRQSIPTSVIPVAVDLVSGALPLHNFVHPENAIYIFGPEDGILGHSTLDWCRHKVYIPSMYCLNLAMAVNVILSDRFTQQIIDGKRPLPESISKMCAGKPPGIQL